MATALLASRYATARGLKLPAGTRLSAVTSVNAQGSITAGYYTTDGKFVALKLTASINAVAAQ